MQVGPKTTEGLSLTIYHFIGSLWPPFSELWEESKIQIRESNQKVIWTTPVEMMAAGARVAVEMVVRSGWILTGEELKD